MQPVEFGKEPTYTPAIFRIFNPSRIEVICDGSESDDLIESYLRRGLTPVMVKHADEEVAVTPVLIDAS